MSYIYIYITLIVPLQLNMSVYKHGLQTSLLLMWPFYWFFSLYFVLEFGSNYDYEKQQAWLKIFFFSVRLHSLIDIRVP